MSEDTTLAKQTNFLTKAENIVTAVILALLLWVGSEVKTTREDVIKMQAQMSNIEQQIDNQKRITDLELKSTKSEVITRVATLEARITSVERSLTQIWPRLRVHGENTALLSSKIKEVCLLTNKEHTCSFSMKVPEKF